METDKPKRNKGEKNREKAIPKQTTAFLLINFYFILIFRTKTKGTKLPRLKRLGFRSRRPGGTWPATGGTFRSTRA